MIENPNWPLLGRAAASRVAQILARHAGWSLKQVPHDYSLPLAACMENKATDLLVTVAGGSLALCAAAMQRTLKDTRSDALIIADESEPWSPPTFAIGRWRSGKVNWHVPLLPWSSDGRTIWLVPAANTAKADHASAFRLAAHYLVAEPVPWLDESQRLAGLDRAARLIRRGSA